MWLFYLINLLLFCYFTHVTSRSANEFYTFRDAKATSLFIAVNNDVEKHSASRAFQIGPSYWCSAGHHTETDFVSWTGELNEKAKISQLDVFWEYAPKEVEVSLSITGDDFNIVMPFKETFGSKPSYKEVFKFDTPHEARFVRLTLRGSINTYFGIREIHIVGYGSPLFMIKSGISSPEGEMCLQLEEGQNTNKARVVLDTCTHAIAASDGRELWRHNSRQQIVSAITYPPKCLTAADPSKHGSIILDDCSDDSLTWEFMGNSQLSLKSTEELCLTQQDEYSSQAGMGNLIEILKSEVKITSTGSTEGHEEKFAIDGNIQTYWASLLFHDSNTHVTNISIDFGKVVHASRVRIDWEYQPFAYFIESSDDNIIFKRLVANLSNASHITTDSFYGTDFRYLRVVMMKPHYSHGKVSGGFIYGIRDISVLTSNLQTVIGDCRAAANSSDARDKYFVSYVSSFDPKLSSKIKSMEDDLHGIINEISEELNHLRESLESTTECMDEKNDYDNHLATMVKNEHDLWKIIQSSQCYAKNGSDPIVSTIGETISNPAEDCHVIKSDNRNATSGFYWIEPKCSKHPLRVYCDMDSLTSIYVWNGKGNTVAPQPLHNLRSPSHIRYQCAAFGLDPLIIKSKHQINELKKALHLMDFENKVESFVPLAYRFGNSNKFKDLLNIFSFMGFPSDIVNDPLVENGEIPVPTNSVDLHNNAAGLSIATGDIEMFDLETSDLSAVVCSTNITDNVVVPVSLTCDDMFSKTNKLSGNLNTNILVRCDEDCSSSKEFHVYGSNGLYSDHSSICKAAIHSGIIGPKGIFTISIEKGLKYYEGSNENGVQSFSYNKSWQGLKDLISKNDKEDEIPDHSGPDCKFSIRILPIEKRCPIVEAHGSFLQISDVKSIAATNNGNEQKISVKSIQEKNVDAEEFAVEQSDPTTKKEALKVINEMDAMYGVDSKSVTAMIEEIAVVVSQSKKRLKPLESVSNHQDHGVLSLLDRVNALSEKASNLFSSSEFQKTMYEKLLADEEGKSVDISDDFKLDYTKMPFSKTFKIHDTMMSSGGPSHWGYSDSPFEDHNNYIVQSSDINSNIKAEGTFAFLKHYTYFDFDMNIDLLSKYEGSIGVAFRVQDQFNYYLFVMNYNESYKQLLKVQDGIVLVLSTNPDGGFTSNKWTNIKISVSHSQITIHSNENIILTALDTSFLHGSIALYSNGTNGTFYFDNIEIKGKPCKNIESPKRLDRLKELPCCHYNETFLGKFDDSYSVINPRHLHTTSWLFKEMFGGKHLAIHQRNASLDSLEIGSLAILKNDRLCNTGFFRFRVFPQCDNGIVGAVLHYHDENNMYLAELSISELRIRKIENGSAKTLSSTSATFIPSRWNIIEIAIEKNSITAKIKNGIDHDSFLREWLTSSDYEIKANVDLSGDLGRGIGLKSYACDSCYFDNIQVSPVIEREKLPLTNFVQELSISNVWKPCITNVHILSRVSVCKKIFRNPKDINACTVDFCEPCCLHHTKLLGEYERHNCQEQCHKNQQIAKLYMEKFESYVNSCISLQGPGFDHCEGVSSTTMM
ncbi:bromodomain containing protein [Theileria equi strain WA]|uniref:Bromodomain containing protein n=1 Tax=Theileria equi strain WA TaxID=1537102 RepID=L0AWB2_THEEQ|nr:bromodomain containing protein [Theileria equi strain WA]AFZ79194.1 bromodomain containing protein [Theileria equi strain WA]|eukprot:XP_004828860.1 bromodomain containing protein [Theileria equi strain WA]